MSFVLHSNTNWWLNHWWRLDLSLLILRGTCCPFSLRSSLDIVGYSDTRCIYFSWIFYYSIIHLLFYYLHYYHCYFIMNIYHLMMYYHRFYFFLDLKFLLNFDLFQKSYVNLAFTKNYFNFKIKNFSKLFLMDFHHRLLVYN